MVESINENDNGNREERLETKISTLIASHKTRLATKGFGMSRKDK